MEALILHFNGRTWTRQQSGRDMALRALAIDLKGRVIVVGEGATILTHG